MTKEEGTRMVKIFERMVNIVNSSDRLVKNWMWPAEASSFGKITLKMAVHAVTVTTKPSKLKRK